MIITEGVYKTFREKNREIKALTPLDTHIKRGECVLCWGPSGSGKTTFLNLISGIVKPTGGTVWLDGEKFSRLPEHFLARIRREKIGIIFQQFHLLSGFSLLDNVAMPLIPLGLNRVERHKKARELLTKLEMDHRLDFPVNHLSGGEQQRAAIARALINDPILITADEPSSAVDAKTTEQILKIFQNLKKEGKTIVLTSHDPAIKNADGLIDKTIFFKRAG
jgi:putative ABC transport system ATP-binding protein